MFDKLELKTDSIYPDALENLGHHFFHLKMPDKNYRECHIYRNNQNEHILTLKLKPYFATGSYCSFELNPSHFKNFNSCKSLIQTIARDNLFIKRIDYAVDINKSIDEIKSIIKINHKRARYDYAEKDKLTGIEFGRDQEIVCIYDKAFEKLTRKKYRKIPDEQSSILTRIEVRQRTKKLPFKDFNSIEKYKSYNPFQLIQFYNLESINNLTKHQSYKAFKLLDYYNNSGTLHGAIKRLNQNSNFKRDYDFIERDLILEEQLKLQYFQSLHNFFGE